MGIIRKPGLARKGLIEQISGEIELAEWEISHGRFQRSMALITTFSSVVSGWEAYIQHQRGDFSNWLMWTPVWLTPPTIAASAAALVNERAARTALPFISLVSLADGIIGFVYHLKGIDRMPGGFKLGQYNIVMGPPLFAPLLTCTTGVLGIIAAMLRREKTPAWLQIPGLADLMQELKADYKAGSRLQSIEDRVAEGEFQRVMAITSAVFATLAGGEAYFEHLRGSYNQRVMWTPVWLTPFMVGAAIGAVRSKKVAETVLPITSAVTMLDGVLGFLLHLKGIRQMPGGFTNLRFNMTMGPPLFAPLLISSAGLLGFIAALLRRKKE